MTSPRFAVRWLLALALVFLAGCASSADETTQVAAAETAAADTPVARADGTAGHAPAAVEPEVVGDPAPGDGGELDILPMRLGAAEQTTGGVPHIQTSADPVADLVLELTRRAYLLPGVENQESIVSLPGAQSLWLSSELQMNQPGILAAGREIGHIHPDGSMHLWLPVERALEVAATQHGELHPWVERDNFWDGVVMVWTPESAQDLDVSVRLIVDAYNLMTGADLDAADFA